MTVVSTWVRRLLLPGFGFEAAFAAPRLTVVVLLAAAWLGFGVELRAQPLSPKGARPLAPASVTAAPPAACAAQTALTAHDAQAWLDGFMPYALRRGAIPGAVVVVVKDGRVLLEKGYGVSDVARATPVDPKGTLFRVGSISKLFTWTAVMQLVEQGRLDLDADVNRYLDFRIPARDGKPITLRNLMTHTSGFEEQVRGIATEDPAEIRPLGAALKAAIPKRIYDPGTTPAYSNYGAALAGYIVERVSGEPFEAYIAHHVFAPLGMDSSSFEQPLQPALMARMSKGYLDASQPPLPYEQIVWRPAGSLSTTGDDMARFLIAHLQEGRLGNARILAPETARLMHTQALTLLPPLNRMDLGFYELNGRRVIGHDGDTVLFHAHVSLFLNEGVGLFLALNGAGKDDAANALRSGLFTGFTDRYFPAPSSLASVPLPAAAAHDRLLAGEYTNSRMFSGSFLFALNMVLPVRVRANPDGTVSVSGFVDLSGALRRYREGAPFVWREVGGRDRLAAVVKDGRVVRFSSDEVSPFMVMLPTPAWRASAILKPALAAFLVVLVTALAWPVRPLVRAVRRAPADKAAEAGAGAGLSRNLVVASAWVILGAVAGWAYVLSLLMAPRGVFQLGQHDLSVHSAQALTMLGVAGGLLAAVWRLVAVLRTPSTLVARGWSIAFALSVAMLAWVAVAGRLVGFSTHF